MTVFVLNTTKFCLNMTGIDDGDNELNGMAYMTVLTVSPLSGKLKQNYF